MLSELPSLEKFEVDATRWQLPRSFRSQRAFISQELPRRAPEGQLLVPIQD